MRGKNDDDGVLGTSSRWTRSYIYNARKKYTYMLRLRIAPQRIFLNSTISARASAFPHSVDRCRASHRRKNEASFSCFWRKRGRQPPVRGVPSLRVPLFQLKFTARTIDKGRPNAPSGLYSREARPPSNEYSVPPNRTALLPRRHSVNWRCGERAKTRRNSRFESTTPPTSSSSVPHSFGSILGDSNTIIH